MKRLLIYTITAALLIIGNSALAQMPYNVQVRTEAYQPLKNAVSLNENKIWDEEKYSIPLGFTVEIGGVATDTLHLKFDTMLSPDSDTNIINALFFLGTDLADRGMVDSVASRSPIRYKITGTEGNHIFKLEYFNAGFYDEYDLYTTMNDSANVQVWLYEAGNKVEYHFGPSKITTPIQYFYFGEGPMVGYADRFVSNTGNGMIYILSGQTQQPTIDSFNTNYIGDLLTQYPEDGTVYVLTPKPLSIAMAKKYGDVKVYPTYATDRIHVNIGNSKASEYIIVSTASGQVYGRGSVLNKQNSIDISSFSSGMYLLNILTEDGVLSYKFVKR